MFGGGVITKALRYFQITQNPIYTGLSYNNLANAYAAQCRFELAHQFLDIAQTLFVRSGDKIRNAFAFDSRAEILRQQNKMREALDAINESISVLATENIPTYLAEAYFTAAKIAATLNDDSLASRNISSCIAICHQTENFSLAGNYLDRYAKLRASVPHPPPKYITNDESEIAEVTFYIDNLQTDSAIWEGIWIESSDYGEFRLSRGCLALVNTSTRVMTHSLVAVENVADGQVYFGHYEFCEDLIILHQPKSAPQIFSQNDSKIIGVVEAVGRKNSDGEIVAQKIA